MAYPGLLTLKAPAKLHMKMLSALVVCCIYLPTLLTFVSLGAKGVDPVQPAHIGTVYNIYLSTLMAVRLRMDAVQARTSNATHASQRESLKPQKLLT